ncbi:MAG TPA: MarR family winged helix-turn-helix transcriptional regulator [Stellaceae bacterium]|nr:MarR family winged helix-turn-helix transcriptional regulator [Stellaceae bacterium]
MKPISSNPLPPEDEAQILDLEHFLPFRLSVLANRVTRRVARVYARRFQLSAPEWRTMAVLGRYGAMTANSVVERTAMDKVRVSRAVARLLARERVTRRTDPDDRRRAILDLTPEGRAVYAKVVPMVLAVESELLSPLGAEERALLDQVLRKLEQHTAVDFAGSEDEI